MTYILIITGFVECRNSVNSAVKMFGNGNLFPIRNNPDSLVFGPTRQIFLTVAGALFLGIALIIGPVVQDGKFDIVTSAVGVAAIFARSRFHSFRPHQFVVGRRTVVPWSSVEAVGPQITFDNKARYAGAAE
jgi:hypothetical protein